MLETLSPSAAVTAAAPTNTTFERSAAAPIQSPEPTYIHSPSEFAPLVHTDTFEPTDRGSVFGGEKIYESSKQSEAPTPEINPLPQMGIIGTANPAGTIFSVDGPTAPPFLFPNTYRSEVQPTPTYDEEDEIASLEKGIVPQATMILEGLAELLGQNSVEAVNNSPRYLEEEELPKPGELPTPEEAVNMFIGLLAAEYNELAPIQKDKYNKGISPWEDVLPVKRALGDSTIKIDKEKKGFETKESYKPISPRVKNEKDSQRKLSTLEIKVLPEITPDAEIAPELETDWPMEPVIDTKTPTAPELRLAAKIVAADATHAAKTLQALQEIEVENAPEIVTQAMTQNLAKEGVKADVTIQAQPETEELTFQIKLGNKDAQRPEVVYIVDRVAQKEREEAFSGAVDEVFEENTNASSLISGPDLLRAYTKNVKEKSELVKQAPYDDGSLGEITQEIYRLPALNDKKRTKEEIEKLLKAKPAVKEGVRDQTVSIKDVNRVLNQTSVLDSTSLPVSSRPRKISRS